MWEHAALAEADPFERNVVGATELGVVEVMAQTRPILAEPLVLRVLLVESADPRRQRFVVISRRDEAARARTEPEDQLGPQRRKQNGRPILDRERRDLGSALCRPVEDVGDRFLAA